MIRKVVFLSFPTDKDTELESLQDEKNHLYELFSAKDHLHTYCRPISTLDSMIADLEKYRDRIILFHFAGHADGNSLLLKDGKAFAQGIAAKLKKCPNLGLVVLNGCSTEDQIELLRQLPSKPVIIATKAPIEDQAALNFAKSFYGQLCEESNTTVKKAFDIAIEDLKFHKGRVRAVRLEEEVPSYEANEYWAISYEKGHESWKLPMAEAPQQDYKANKILRVKLLKAMALQNELVKREYEKAAAEKWNEGAKQEIILKNIPITISEQIRKLFSRPIGKGDHSVFYHEVSNARLKQYVIIYKTLVEFLTFTLFADLCIKLIKKTDLAFEIKEKLEIKNLFNVKLDEIHHSFYPNLIEKIRSTFKHYKLPFFLKGMDQLASFTDLSNTLGLAVEYLEDLANKRIESLGTGEIHQHCVEGEKKLSQILEETAFLSNFTVLSVRQIRVLKAPHEQRAVFEHMYYRMIPNANREYSEISESRKTYLENLCVFLEANQKNDNRYLNLSPFFIDVNAIILDLGRIPKEYKPKLHSLIGFSESNNCIEYKHIYTPTEKCRICQEELDDIEIYPYKDEYEDEIRTRTPFQFISDQLNAYAKRLLDNPLITLEDEQSV